MQSRPKLSPTTRMHWKKILDFARMEASAAVAAKNKKFLGLKKFAQVAAKRKQEAVKRKENEKIEEEQLVAEVAQAAVRSRRSILSMLDVELTPVERQNVRGEGLHCNTSSSVQVAAYWRRGPRRTPTHYGRPLCCLGESCACAWRRWV